MTYGRGLAVNGYFGRGELQKIELRFHELSISLIYLNVLFPPIIIIG